jgi:peptidyl-prolyl cis-trans isomerase C
MNVLRRSIPCLLMAAAAVAAGCGSNEPAATDSAGPAVAPPGAPGQSEAAPAAPPPSEQVLGTPSSGAGTPGEPAARAADEQAAQAADEPELLSDQIPEVVARVDGHEFTRAELLSRASVARSALAGRGIRPRPTRTFYLRVLEDLIGNWLAVRELEKQGKAATPAEVDAQIAEIRSRFASEEELDRSLAERGFDRARLRQEISESITVRRWVEESVAPSVEVSEEQVRSFFEANRDQMMEPEKVRARHILVAAGEGASAEQRQAARGEIEALRSRIEGGADFAEIARASSDDKSSGARGGDLGWFYRGQMVPSFDQVAFSLAPGELSSVVESPFGFHLIQVQEHVGETPVEFEQVRDELTRRLRQYELEQAVRRKLDELGESARVEILL